MEFLQEFFPANEQAALVQGMRPVLQDFIEGLIRLNVEVFLVVLQDAAHYVRGTFGWGGVVGGFVFGLGAMFAGGCGTGTLWRVGEGQLKLWLVVPFFGVSNSLMTAWFKVSDVEGKEDWLEEGITNSGKLGEFVYMPDTFLGYGGTLILIALAMAAWYLVVDWNEDSNKLIVEM